MKHQSKHSIGQIVVWKYTQCQIMAISTRTGGLTIQLKADCAPYKMGDKVSVMPFDVLPYRAVCAPAVTPLPIVLSIKAKYLEEFVQCEYGAHEDEMTGPSPLTTVTILERHKTKIECLTYAEAAQVLDCCRYGTFPHFYPGVAERLNDLLYAMPEVNAIWQTYSKGQWDELKEAIKSITP